MYLLFVGSIPCVVLIQGIFFVCVCCLVPVSFSGAFSGAFNEGVFFGVMHWFLVFCVFFALKVRWM